jgi:hypothetical protein
MWMDQFAVATIKTAVRMKDHQLSYVAAIIVNELELDWFVPGCGGSDRGRVLRTDPLYAVKRAWE